MQEDTRIIEAEETYVIPFHMHLEWCFLLTGSAVHEKGHYSISKLIENNDESHSRTVYVVYADGKELVKLYDYHGFIHLIPYIEKVLVATEGWSPLTIIK